MDGELVRGGEMGRAEGGVLGLTGREGTAGLVRDDPVGVGGAAGDGGGTVQKNEVFRNAHSAADLSARRTLCRLDFDRAEKSRWRY